MKLRAIRPATGKADVDHPRDPHENPALDLVELAQALPALADIPDNTLEATLAEVSALQVGLAAVQSALLGRLRVVHSNARGAADDRLLTVAEAAERLGTSKDWLYRHSRKLEFVVRQGRQLRFSSRGIDRYIKRQQGRPLEIRGTR